MKKDNITEEQLDEMIKDLEDDSKESLSDSVQEKINKKLKEIFNIVKECKKELKDDLSIETLTIGDLKQLIREVVSEELVKREISYPVYPLPPQPMPVFYENPYRPAHEVWCDTKTTPVNLKEPTCTNATTNKMSYYQKTDEIGEVHG